ncbi:hypothetical protein K435DRAFT_526435 [Dendrothele bispora CBS 962.96]|uniref:Association with the SNF1 complex (ASC) domain-containing protein n=1 Tax=Dendrothele bispora (strain CBS 962.96) TaxID=1314807 RepID=A0A4S8M8B5_DENBC|nr:hypothetical protein K435DRAFT_526435 [Dendrothele bispora CBS 962.96]
MGHSFWSASSTIDVDDDIQQPVSPKTSPVAGSPTKPLKRSGPRYTPRWTNEIPLELLQAAGEEEAYLSYQTRVQQQMLAQQQYDAYGRPIHSRTPVQISGFVPLPNIPPAPSLPRYLDKLILNTHVQAKTGVGVSLASPAGELEHSNSVSSRGGRERVRSPVRDRDRERERVRSPLRDRDREREREIANRDRDRERDRDARRRERRSLGMTAEETMNMASTFPITGDDASGSGMVGVGSSTLTRSSSAKQNAKVFDETVVADDNSVLPVPSHVVLHHLCTSAIRNGVLAVGETVRYRQKVGRFVFFLCVRGTNNECFPGFAVCDVSLLQTSGLKTTKKRIRISSSFSTSLFSLDPKPKSKSYMHLWPVHPYL